jgi:hypothetical protein
MKTIMDKRLKNIFCEPYIEIPDWAAAIALAAVLLLAGFGGSW